MQQIKVGDGLPAVPNTKDAFIVQEVISFNTLILVVPILGASEEADNIKRMNDPLKLSWSLNLEPLDYKVTELISNERISTEWLAFSPSKPQEKKLFIEHVIRLFSKMPWFLIQPFAMTGHYIMESRLLKGIREEQKRVN